MDVRNLHGSGLCYLASVTWPDRFLQYAHPWFHALEGLLSRGTCVPEQFATDDHLPTEDPEDA